MIDKEFSQLIKHIPHINIELEKFDYDDTGAKTLHFFDDNFEIEANKWLIRCCIEVSEKGMLKQATYEFTEEWEVSELNSDVTIKEVWDEDELTLTDDQKTALEKEIKKRINT